jgi:hypothetical protein
MKKVDIVAVMKDGAEEIQRGFKNPDDDWFPVLMIQSKGLTIPCMLKFDDDKEQICEGIANLLRKVHADEAVLVASSWYVERGPDHPLGLDLPVREQPDRKEVLMLSHVTRDSVNVFMAEIHRHESAPPTLGPWKDSGSDLGISGLFADAMRLGIG